MPRYKLKDLARHVAGEISGDGEIVVKGVSPIETAKPGFLVFILESRHLSAALKSGASAVLASSGTSLKGKPGLLVKNPRLAMAVILALFSPPRKVLPGVHELAVVPSSCKVGRGASIGPFVVLGENVSVGARTEIRPHVFIGDNSSIGSGCLIHSNVSIYSDVKVGDRVVLHSGTRIGVDGFGFVPEGGRHAKIPQLGGVVIEDDVEIFSNVCISRGTLGATLIGAGTKIDNLTHIAHNCRIGKNCAIVSLVGFAGSVTLGDHVYVAGQVGFKGHNSIGNNSVIMARAGVTKDFPANSILSGFPAQDHSKEMASQAAIRRLIKKNK